MTDLVIILSYWVIDLYIESRGGNGAAQRNILLTELKSVEHEMENGMENGSYL